MYTLLRKKRPWIDLNESQVSFYLNPFVCMWVSSSACGKWIT